MIKKISGRKLFAIARATFFLSVSVCLTLVAYAQTNSPGVSLDGVTKIFAIASTILGLGVGALQLYIANRVATVEAKLNKNIVDVKEKFYEVMHEEVEKLEERFGQRVQTLENRMATKDDIQNLKQILELSMKSLEIQIKRL